MAALRGTNPRREQRGLKETAMRHRPIVITETDARKLRELLLSNVRANRDQDHLHELAEELRRASIVDTGDAPDDVITLNAHIEVLDLSTSKRRKLTLVLPPEADATAGLISVLAPLGTALLGYRAGDEFEWRMPGGLRRLRIERVLRADPSLVSRPRDTAVHAIG